MKSLLIKIFTVVLLVVFLCSGWKLYETHSRYEQAQKEYERLEQHVVLPSETANVPTEEQDTHALQYPQVDFAALAAINEDVVGWLSIDGTSINYPIVQGADNDFYLTHQFDGKYNRGGCLFLAAENDATFWERNQIIYGHYMNDRSMFYDITKYKKQAFFDAHPTGWLITPEETFALRFFSGYVSDVYGDGWEIAFSEIDYGEWLEKRKEKSVFSSDVAPEADDSVLTLSTCSYEFEDARFVLHAVLEVQKIALDKY